MVDQIQDKFATVIVQFILDCPAIFTYRLFNNVVSSTEHQTVGLLMHNELKKYGRKWSSLI